MATRRWGWGVAAGAAGICAACAVGAGSARSAAAGTPEFAGTITACSQTVGTVVAVDFGTWQGPTELGCDTSNPPHGIDLLTGTGFTTAGDEHDGPGFICRIGGPLFDTGAQYPTPSEDPCIVTPPASAYWSYWLAPAGAQTWTYSPLGADSDVPTVGEAEAWTFGATNVSGTSGRPSFTPAQVRAQETATGTTPTTRSTPTSATPTATTTTTTMTTIRTAPVTTVPRTTSAVPGTVTTTTVSPTPTTTAPMTHDATVGRATAGELAAAGRYLAHTTGANGLAHGTSLTRNGYYESAPRFADFGLTIDGGFALVAAHRQTVALNRAIAFIADARHDGSHRSINTWTEIGTADADGGSVAKEALFAEVVGRNPRRFAGHDLIRALDGLRCTRTAKPACAGGAGSFRYGASTFDEALAVMAELRAGDRTHARPAIAFLEHLQHSSGAWPSIIPSTGDSDVDSSAVAAMALALVSHDPGAVRAEQHGLAWIASRQLRDGGFPGAAGNSTNSAALAVQALSLDGARYAGPLRRARGFLLGEQNHDGGFAVAAAGPQSSDVRASTQVLGGLIGTSFGTLAVR